MSELREELMDTIKGVKEGTIPTKTAEAVHLTAHRHVMDRNADCREEETFGKKFREMKTKQLFEDVVKKANKEE